MTKAAAIGLLIGMSLPLAASDKREVTARAAANRPSAPSHSGSVVVPALNPRPSEGDKRQESNGPGDQRNWREQYAKLPLSFEANLGQTGPQVEFLSRGSGYTLFLTKSDAVLTLHGSGASAKPPVSGASSGQAKAPGRISMSVLRMKLAGASPTALALGADQLPGKINYFIGNDPKKWRGNIPTYGQVVYHGVYPGVDLTYYGNQNQLEYDFAVSPGADPRTIRLQLQGAGKVRLDRSGDLILGTWAGEVRLCKPDVYQTDPAAGMVLNEQARGALARREIASRYVVRHNHEIGFVVGAYNPQQTLIIDPVLVYSTYLGGSNDEKLSGIGVTPSGQAVVAGDTASDDFPVTAGAYQPVLGGSRNVFVTELSADGSSLVFSTYLGGNASDGGWGVAIDSSGNIYADGFTSSSNFPVVNAYQGTFVGTPTTDYDVFLSKFDSSGSKLLYSTYIGKMDYATLVDGQVGLAANNSGLAYVCSTTNDPNYPHTAGAYQTTLVGTDDGVLTVLDTTKSGSSSLVYSTFLGGSAPSNATTTILNIALDSSDNVYATGYTKSTNFPTTSGAFQPKCPQTGTCTANAFVSKINPAGQGSKDLVYSTYFGGTDTHVTHGLGIAVDSSGDAYVAGFTQAAGLPTTPGAFQGTCSKCGGSANLYDGFVAAFNLGGAGLIYATYLGGESYDEPKVIALDSANDAYVVGRTTSTQFPTLNPLQAAKAGPTATSSCQSGDCPAFDGFITELNPTGTGLVFSTFNGGSKFDSWNANAVDSAGNIYVGGRTESLDYAATAGVFQPAHAAIVEGSAGLDAAVAKISPTSAPGVGFGPASLTFSSQAVGTTSPSQAIVLTAAGSASVTVSSISVTGPFAQTNTCGTLPVNLSAGTQCTVNVTFSPTATGSQNGTLTITDNAASSPQNIPLTGTGTATGPVVSLSPTSLTFASQPIGTTSPAQSVTLTNTGVATLSVTTITLTGTNPGDFAQTNTCGTKVSAGASCTISVTFTPTAAGTRTASIGITDNAPGSPQSVPLTGTGGTPVVSLSPTSLTFPLQVVGQSGAPQTVTVTNTGTGALGITSISISGTNSRDYTQTNTCGTSVAAGANCSINVTFKPHQSSPPTSMATLSITDNAAGSPQVVSLSGTGTFVQLVPTSLTFASQAVGTRSAAQTVTLTNTEPSQTLTITPSITGSDPGDFAQTNTCGVGVAPGASCTISVTFTPAAPGTRSAALSIADAGGGSPQTVSLTGTGAGGPAVTLSPTSLSFGVQVLGTFTALKAVSLTNSGTGTLTITSITIGGTDPGDFVQTNTCGSTLSAGAKCTIDAKFKPAATGTRTASLSVADNATGSPQTVALSGIGTAVKLSPTSLSFGSVQVGQSSGSQTVTLTNAGSVALGITSIGITGSNPGDFSETTTCGASLGAGKSCGITVTFTPKTTGARSAAVSISDNGGGSPQKVSLSGTGT